jgi:alpha-tubulin suppressor-like RCC1 family protein
MTDAVVATPTRVLLDSLAEPILSIAAGGMHSLAVDTAGHVWSWGQNKFGQLGRESVDSDRCGSPDRVALPTDVQTLQAAAGWAHSALVSTDGRVFTFGWGMYHQLGHGAAQNEREPVMVDALVGLDVSSRVVQVACGTWHTGGRRLGNRSSLPFDLDCEVHVVWVGRC